MPSDSFHGTIIDLGIDSRVRVDEAAAGRPQVTVELGGAMNSVAIFAPTARTARQLARALEACREVNNAH